MQRREFITLLGGAVASPGAWPRAARAQPGAMPRVGVLIPFAADDPETKARLAGFRQGFERLGWFEGRNVRIDYRFAPVGADLMLRPARELIALQPDVILVHGTLVAAALQQATRAVPIVFVAVSDPIGAGLIASLARPGGNLTGFLNFEATIVGKWLAMLQEIAPKTARALLLCDPKTTDSDYFFSGARAAAPALAIEAVRSDVESAADIEHAIASASQAPNSALVVLPNSVNTIHRDLINALAVRYRLPAVYALRVFAASGGLMSYGTDLPDTYRQAAAYISRILRGEKPVDLPVQAPTRYVTVLNLKTAKALGLTVPDLMLVRADEVIE
jgi:ABC-type uncharacterized transport system substrate-binding protein